MSQKYPGGLITKSPITPSGPYQNDTASGIWTLDQQVYWQKLGQWPTAGNLPVDPQFNYVTMLLHGDGTNGAQNNTFLDSSSNNFTITRNGNTTQGSFSPYGSNWSNYFATSAGVQFPYTSSLTSWWTQDFTMEMWIFNNTNAVSGTNSLPLQFAHGVYNSTPTFWSFGTNASGQVEFYYFNGSGIRLASTTTASLGTWNHIAMVYTNSSGNISLYLNGVSVASATKSGTPQNSVTSTVNIGAVQNTYYNGYISNLRVLNGTALYTTTFTPSTTPLTAITNTQLLTCQSNRFVDNSTNNATPTIIGTPSVQRFNPFGASTAYSTSVIGGSGYFDGNGDYLTVPDASALDFGTGNFTMEAWVYATSLANNPFLMHKSTGNGSNTGWFFEIGPGAVYFGPGTSSGTFATFSSSAISTNNWFHIAVTRVSTTIQCFVNGTSIGTSTASNYGNNVDNSAAFGIGSWQVVSNSFDLAGYISDLRVVKGTAVYTSNFTPPTAPLTAITNTSLLLNTTNGAIFDNAMMNDLETVGNAQISTSVVKYGTGSLYFDGTGDYLQIPSTPNFAFKTGDFTIEFWWYPLSSALQEAAFFTVGAALSSANAMSVFTDTSRGLLVFSNGVYIVSGYGADPTVNQWNHMAVTRTSGTLRTFVNGIFKQSASFTNSINAAISFVGRLDSTALYDPNGYIDDMRITTGYSRYPTSTNFTPPTVAFFNYGPN